MNKHFDCEEINVSTPSLIAVHLYIEETYISNFDKFRPIVENPTCRILFLFFILYFNVKTEETEIYRGIFDQSRPNPTPAPPLPLLLLTR